MSIQTALTKRLGMTYPIFQAPLAGGGDTPALVAAVCEAGGLGFIGAAYLTPEQIGEAAREVQAQTSRPFGINLFAPVPMPDPPKIRSRPSSVSHPSSPSWAWSRPAVPAPARDSFNNN